MSVLSNRLKEARNRAGYKQIEAAKRIGISNGTLSGYEREYRDPDTETLEKMAEVYDVSIDWLLGRSNKPGLSEDEEFQAFANNPELQRFYEELPKSDEEDLEKLRAMWEIIKKKK
ncbi:helix-turn-helix transcriptional regulator [Halobacillus sp. Cin3]|uniref:helix-turn-helix domain-containing protein n=1 Tax=Halobacillus sp. Cin3 TaxID=2928441 RepID=UPI00248D53E7|nr:helix-turn-helix transcriptional regulator [Halobacillus sp. Cin3]